MKKIIKTISSLSISVMLFACGGSREECARHCASMDLHAFNNCIQNKPDDLECQSEAARKGISCIAKCNAH